VLKSERWEPGSSGAASVTELRSLIQAATQWTWVRNEVGCHFSLAGQGVPDSDVRAFAERSLNLAEAIFCDACGELPARNKSGSYWQCTCGLRRLYPLIPPGTSAAPV
jgi:hypothetical protein